MSRYDERDDARDRSRSPERGGVTSRGPRRTGAISQGKDHDAETMKVTITLDTTAISRSELNKLQTFLGEKLEPLKTEQKREHDGRASKRKGRLPTREPTVEGLDTLDVDDFVATLLRGINYKDRAGRDEPMLKIQRKDSDDDAKTAVLTDKECVICAETFAQIHGVVCDEDHFTCHKCAPRSLSSVTRRIHLARFNARASSH